MVTADVVGILVAVVPTVARYRMDESSGTIEDELSLSIDQLDLPPRARNALRSEGIFLIGDLVQCRPADLERIRNFGRRSLARVNQQLALRGLHLHMRVPKRDR